MSTQSGDPWGIPRKILLLVALVGVVVSPLATFLFAQGSALNGELHASGIGLPTGHPSTAISVLWFCLLCPAFLSILSLNWLGRRVPVLLASAATGLVAFNCVGASFGNPATWCNFAYSCPDLELQARDTFSNAGVLTLLCLGCAAVCFVLAFALPMRSQGSGHPRATRIPLALVVPLLGVPASLLLVGGGVRQGVALLPPPTPSPIPTTPTPVPVTPGPAHLADPFGITVGPGGAVWVVEPGQNRVVGLGPRGGVAAFWVLGGSGVAGLRGPEDIAASPDGLLFIADTGYNRVVAFDNHGKFKGIWARSGHSWDHVWHPRGVATARKGGYSLDIADPGNHLVHALQRPGFGYASRVGNVADVAAGGDSISFYTLADGYKVQWQDTLGSKRQLRGAFGSRPGELRGAQGIAVGQAVYVADTGNNRIERFSLKGKLLAVWSSQGWKHPSDVAVDERENVYVADTGNSRVVKVSSAGRILMVWK